MLLAAFNDICCSIIEETIASKNVGVMGLFKPLS
jgi:hypothetical protein